jgi:hypothetical protein
MQVTRLSVSLLLLLALAGCASVTMVSSVKEQSAAPKSYRSFLVVGITQNLQTRQVFEGVMAAELRKRGLSAVPSYTVTGVEEKLSVALVEKAALAAAVDAVITAKVVDLKRKTHKDVGYAMTERGVDSYAGIYGGVGTVSYATFDMKPVEITTSTTYGLESHLFDTATKGLVWTGTSNAVDPQGLITASEKFAGVVINTLTREGLIK